MFELKAVSVSRGDFVLGPIDLSIEEGVTGIIGPNGSGKSTLCRIAAGIDRSDGGDVLLEGESLRQLSAIERAARLSFVPQELPPGEGFSLMDFVAMGFYRFSRDYSRAGRQTAITALATVDLERRGGQQYGSLSGGEKRRAVLARALVQDAATLILDEPGSFLDYAHSRVMVSVLRNLGRQSGRRVVVVSHDCGFLGAICDRVIGMRNGSVVRHGAAAELLQSQDFLSDIYGMRFTRSGERLLPDFSE